MHWLGITFNLCRAFSLVFPSLILFLLPLPGCGHPVQCDFKAVFSCAVAWMWLSYQVPIGPHLSSAALALTLQPVSQRCFHCCFFFFFFCLIDWIFFMIFRFLLTIFPSRGGCPALFFPREGFLGYRVIATVISSGALSADLFVVLGISTFLGPLRTRTGN